MDRPAEPNPLTGPAAQVSAAAILLLGGMWVAQQGGIISGHADLFLGCLYEPIMSVRFLVPLWVGAAGLGWAARLLVAPRARPGLLIQMGAGLALLLLCFWALGVGGWLNAVTAWCVCGLGAAMLVHQALQPPYRTMWIAQQLPCPSWLVLLGCPILGLMVVACTCVPGAMWRIEAYGYDVLSYHLQLPREWLAQGKITGLHHNVYSYLPNLVEAGYMAIGAMAGSMRDAIYVVPMFHATAGVLAAAAIGGWVSRATRNDPRTTPGSRATAAAIAGALLLVLPWTVVTGTLAYDEMFALALGCSAMVVAFDPIGQTWRGAALAGFLGGAATLAKLPFGPMIALPIGLVYLAGWGEKAVQKPESKVQSPRSKVRGTRAPGPRPWALDFGPWTLWRRRAALAAVAGLAGLLTLSPYFVRNAQWTGNPVFPFAAKHLGKSYWSDFDVERWNRGHGLSGAGEHRLWNLGRHWFFNAGYGALGSMIHPTLPPDEARHNIAHFTEEWGFPLFWLIAAAGAAVGLAGSSRGPIRCATVAMLVTLAVQLAFWLGATHMQSRFLIPSLLPGCGLVGLLISWLLRQQPSQNARPRAAPLVVGAAVILVAAFTVNTFHVFFQQTVGNAKPWQITDALLPPPELDKLTLDDNVFGNHRLNHLPPDSLTYLVADNSDLFFIRRPFIYNSAFDPCELGAIIRERHADPAGVTAALKARGITHVWVHWGELKRLHETYGFDPDVTPESLSRIAQGAPWRTLDTRPGWYTLYELP